MNSVLDLSSQDGFHGVMVSTLDSESSDPSSNLGGTFTFFWVILLCQLLVIEKLLLKVITRRDSSVGRALD